MLEMSAITKPKMSLTASSFIVLCARIQPKITYAELERRDAGRGWARGEVGCGIEGEVSTHGRRNYKDTKPKMSSLLAFNRVYIDWRYNQPLL
jgi:hypothetical protein